VKFRRKGDPPNWFVLALVFGMFVAQLILALLLTWE